MRVSIKHVGLVLGVLASGGALVATVSRALDARIEAKLAPVTATQVAHEAGMEKRVTRIEDKLDRILEKLGRLQRDR